jgi:phosphoribosylanthranilate isomerase
MSVEVKICGITDEDAMETAVEAGADYVGLVFYAPSPRAVTAARAAELVEYLPDDIITVGLFVDPDDALLNDVLTHVRLDLLQFHGSESPERLEAIRLEYGLPIMKMIPVSCAEDLAAAEPYLAVCDRLLFDAKPPQGATLPGGNAVAFDWTILQGRRWGLPWMLAGGLTPETVAEAVRISGARAVDVSSGVESAPGVKDPARIHAFINAVKSVKPGKGS